VPRDEIQRVLPGPGQRPDGAGGCLFPVPLRCVSRSSGNEVHRRPGDLREVDDAREPGGGYVVDRIPELAAVAAQPGPRHVQFDDDHVLDAAAVAADRVQERSGGPSRRVQPVDRQPAAALAAQQSPAHDAIALLGKSTRFVFVPGSLPDDMTRRVQVEADGTPGMQRVLTFAAGERDEGLNAGCNSCGTRHGSSSRWWSSRGGEARRVP
jgi:hypothetical protein